AEYQNDDFGCVTEAVAADGQKAHDGRGQLIQEQQPERKPAEKIEPEIALDQNDGEHVSNFPRSRPSSLRGIERQRNPRLRQNERSERFRLRLCPVYNPRSMRE